MKYDILYNWISPLTGRIADYTQLPDLPTGDIWIGDSAGRPSPVPFTPISNTLQKDYTFVGNNSNVSQPSPALIDIRLDLIDINYDIVNLQSSSYILQTPNSSLPNSQALNTLSGGILKSDINGIISIAIADTDYMGGVSLSIPDTVVVFADEDGKKIKMAGSSSNPVIIDGNGNLKAQGVMVRDTINTTTGFVAPAISDGSIYSLPATGGFVTQVLAILSLPTGGITPTFWMTIPGSVTKPRNPDDPYPPPIWIPLPPIEDPTAPPVPTPVTPLPPITPFPPFTIPILPIPITPFPPFSIPTLPTPGGGYPDNSVPTYKPNTDDPTTGDPYEITPTDVTIDPTTGDIDTPGGVTTGGPVTTPEIVLTPTDTPTNTITIKPPSSVTAPYIITLPPTAGTEGQVLTQGANGDWIWTDPAATDITIEPSTGITITGTPTDVIVGLDDSGVVPDSYFIPNIQVDRYGRVVEAFEPENQQLVDLVYGTLANFPVLWGGFASNERDYPFKVKTSYYIPSGDFSSSSLLLFNRDDNGYILKTKTQYGQNPNFFFEQKLGNTVTDLYSYNGNTQKFAYFKPINMGNNIITGLPTPTNPSDATNKEYVDLQVGNGGTVTSITFNNGLSGGTITDTGTVGISNTGVTAATYRMLANAAVNSRGQITSASNGSPATTTNNAIAVWGNATGTSLINTSVTIDSTGNIAGSGSATFLAPQISNADGIGSLNFLSGGFSLQLRLSGSLTNNRLWFLPTNNTQGFFKNNGSGTISWSTLSSSDISNFSTAVTAFRLDQFAIPTANLNLNNKNITNLADPVNSQDAATKNYVNSQIANIPNTGNITFSGDNIDSTSQGINFVSSNVDFYQTTQFHNGIHVGPTYVSFARADPASIFVFPLGGSLFVDLQSRLCFKDKNGSVAIIVNPN